MGLDIDYIDGQTPLDEDEKEGLLIPTIVTRGELDEFEQQNIEKAIAWSLTRNFRAKDIFTEAFVKNVHKRMYDDVWAWAGEFRKTKKNIGVNSWQVAVELKNLLDDAMYWTNKNIFPPDEIALRFKHRIVRIHCFPNGNGRHSRLIADIIIEKIYNQPIFSWGATNLSPQGDMRAAYLKAIKAADNQDYSLLLAFARS